MHWIQFHILDQLIHASSRRFSELRPDSVESNLFQWHLKQVIKLGYVEKLSDGTGYRLSAKGLYYADRLSETLRTERVQPKIITIVALHNPDGRFLLHSKHRQPYISMAQFPAGKVHNDESLHQAAEREMVEKLGVVMDGLSYVGGVHARVRQGGELTSEYFGFLFAGEFNGGLPKDTFWYNPKNPPADVELMPSVQQIMDYVMDGGGGMYEFEIIDGR
jgi:8-oxo-dGTP pyrophosphatase MutT (NUDIX family)